MLCLVKEPVPLKTGYACICSKEKSSIGRYRSIVKMKMVSCILLTSVLFVVYIETLDSVETIDERV